ncbi:MULTISPECIES: hypoxanthine phosphoribosyltransferase [unclassified Lactococcus]|uniref:hypoxanthine phosphoribosyltransferase n=1 Tax=unclassified Lactococcus TaxID=2643510 RepID=UPI0011CBE7DA|nr:MULTISPECIES: hypoxanthine phosphoribosyltransferase [unclassified Lactococcus]MQW22676.1 hypoxanthine phosphoribosyltransferase [Lactococcus sp. dk101]TXK44684.1 hypoxanthine phosphoribosyltransferase [Lactococcus sp. dk310]TXK50578.1 hypoxanthine phosphoribosyltransferase [Lactococcus sp. dk322]
MLEKDIEKVLVSEEEIRVRSTELGAVLTEEYKDKNPLVLGILRGSVPFMAELIKHMDCHLEMDFMTVSSYHGGTKSSGEVKLIMDVDTAVRDRDILIVEDIIDTGRTLKYLKELLEHRGARVKIVTLLDKPSGRLIDIEPEWTGFTIPNEFVIGFGLDYENNYRNLPYVGVLKEEIYTK